MSGFLVDTNVLCEPQVLRPAAKVITWLRRHEAALYTSAVVIGEIAWGIERLRAGKKRHELTRWFQDMVIRKMEGRILRLDTRVALEWGALQAMLESRGRPMPWRDSVIAATTRRHGLTLATRNTRDFKDVGVEVVNPFD